MNKCKTKSFCKHAKQTLAVVLTLSLIGSGFFCVLSAVIKNSVIVIKHQLGTLKQSLCTQFNRKNITEKSRDIYITALCGILKLLSVEYEDGSHCVNGGPEVHRLIPVD